jgi:hypothetical protein
MMTNTATSRRKGDALAVLLLLLIPTVLFADVIFFGSTFFYRDLTSYFYPTKRIVRDIILGGDFPYWNHWYSGGQPLAANPEFQIFYPLQAPILLPDYDLGYQIHLLLHIHLGLVGMYLLLRSMALRIPSAFFGAMAFGLGGFYLSYLNIPPFFFTLAWLPLVLLFLRRFLIRPIAVNFAVAGLVLGIQLLAAEPTTILQTGLLMAAYASWRGWQDPNAGAQSRVRSVVRRIAQTAAVILAGSAVGAVQIIPMLDLVSDTPRVGGFNSFEMISIWSMHPLRALELFFPRMMGHNEQSGLLYWGRSLSEGRGPYLVSLYVGLFAAVMMVAGAVTRRRGRGVVLAVAAASFLIALGSYTPLLEVLFDAGIFRSFRYPEKFILMGMVVLIVYSALTFDRAVRGDRQVALAAIVTSATIAIASAGMFVLAWLPRYPSWFASFWSLPDEPQIRFMAGIARIDWLYSAATAAALALLLFALLRRGPSRGWYAVVLAFLLFDVAWRANQLVERLPGEFLSPPAVVRQLRPDRAAYRIFHEPGVDADLGRRPAWPTDVRFWLVRNGLFYRTPSAWGFRTVLDGDYDLTNLTPTRDLYEALLRTRDRGLARAPEVYLAMSNVGHVVRMKEGSSSRFTGDVETQIPVTILTTSPYPRYYFSDQMVLLRDFDDFVDKTIRRGWSPRVAFVQGPPFVPSRGRVLRVSERPNDTRLEVQSEGRGYLVISITPHKYWRASIDGREAPLLRTNVGYQGLVIPPGRHVVELRYRNPLIVAGGVVSGSSMLLLFGIAVVRRRA